MYVIMKARYNSQIGESLSFKNSKVDKGKGLVQTSVKLKMVESFKGGRKYISMTNWL